MVAYGFQAKAISAIQANEIETCSGRSVRPVLSTQAFFAFLSGFSIWAVRGCVSRGISFGRDSGVTATNLPLRQSGTGQGEGLQAVWKCRSHVWQRTTLRREGLGSEASNGKKHQPQPAWVDWFPASITVVASMLNNCFRWAGKLLVVQTLDKVVQLQTFFIMGYEIADHCSIRAPNKTDPGCAMAVATCREV